MKQGVECERRALGKVISVAAPCDRFAARGRVNGLGWIESYAGRCILLGDGLDETLQFFVGQEVVHLSDKFVGKYHDVLIC